MKFEMTTDLNVNELAELFLTDKDSDSEVFYQIRTDSKDGQFDFAKNGESLYFQAKDNGKLVAHFTAYNIDLDHPELSKYKRYYCTDYFVHAAYRNRNLAKELSKFATAYFGKISDSLFMYAIENHNKALKSMSERDYQRELYSRRDSTTTLHLVPSVEADFSDQSFELENLDADFRRKDIQIDYTKLLAFVEQQGQHKALSGILRLDNLRVSFIAIREDRYRSFGLTKKGREVFATDKEVFKVLQLECSAVNEEELELLLSYLNSQSNIEFDFIALRDVEIGAGLRKKLRVQSYVAKIVSMGELAKDVSFDNGLGVFSV